MHVAVSIVAWNSMKYLPEAFASLERQTFRDFTVILVDNASNDDPAAHVRTVFPRAVVLRNTHNLGFSRAHNQAISYAKARLTAEHGETAMLIMNPDVVLEPDFLANLVDALERKPDAASVCGKLLRMVPIADGPVIEGEKTHTIDTAGLRVRKTRRVSDRGSGEQDGSAYDTTMEVFGPSGALALYRMKALESVAIGDEYFDNDLFAYKEDVDMAWRMRLRGWKSYYAPRALAYHYRTARGKDKSSIFAVARGRGSKSTFVNFLSYRNHLLVLVKNEQFVNFLAHAPYIVGYEFVKFLFTLVMEPRTLRAVPSLLWMLPRMLRKRRVGLKGAVPAKVIREWFA